MAKAPKNDDAPKNDEAWEDEPAQVPAEATLEVVCVSHDRPHHEDNKALIYGQREHVRVSVAKKLLKNRHVVRAEDFDEAPANKDAAE